MNSKQDGECVDKNEHSQNMYYRGNMKEREESLREGKNKGYCLSKYQRRQTFLQLDE